MPHPVIDKETQSVTAASPPHTTQHNTTYMNNSLLSQANNCANINFQSNVKSVLRHTSITSLRRLLSNRIRMHFEKLSLEQLTTSTTTSVEELLSSEDESSLLYISQEDIDTCYKLEKRIGNKWSEVLRRQGYHEYATIVLDVVQQGCFLEVESSEGNGQDDSTQKSNNDDKYITPYTALHALRRYPSDCVNGPLPSEYLPDISTNPDHQSSTARKVIQQIDKLAKSGQTNYWQYGWESIEQAVARNKQRIVYDNNGWNVGEEEGVKVKKRSRSKVQFKEEDDERSQETDMNFTSKEKSTSILKRRKRKHDNDDVTGIPRSMDDEQLITERGRPASSIGHVKMSWDDILNSVSIDERQQLIISNIHPPYPFELNMQESATNGDNDNSKLLAEAAPSDDDDQSHSAVICGALKEIGQTHLWEQTRHLPLDTNDIADEEGPDALGSFKSQQLVRRQKRALTRATKERLGRRTVCLSEHRSQHEMFVKCSKVKWTEHGKSAGEKEGQTEASSRQRKWLEMDLGECTIEVADEHIEKTDKSEQGKKILAFRSLELALKF